MKIPNPNHVWKQQLLWFLLSSAAWACAAMPGTWVHVQKELVLFTGSQRWDWIPLFPLPSKWMGFCCWLHWSWDISTLGLGQSESAAGIYKYRITWFCVTQSLKGSGLRNRVSLYGKKYVLFSGDEITVVLSISNRLLQELHEKNVKCSQTFILLALYFITIRGSVSGLQCFLRSCRGTFLSFREG